MPGHVYGDPEVPNCQKPPIGKGVLGNTFGIDSTAGAAERMPKEYQSAERIPVASGAPFRVLA